jgi:hypothetical protein
MQLTREGSEIRHGGRLIITCATPQMAQHIATMIDAVARLDAVDPNAQDFWRDTVVAMILATAALRRLEQEATLTSML